MEHYRYPATTLAPDYLRVAFGLAATAGPLVALDLARGVAAVLSGLALLFAWFGVRTALRQLSWIELSATDIALCGPIRRRLPWQQIRSLQLAYYAPRRARRDGWLQLSLRGRSGAAIRVDFDPRRVRRAVAAGGRRRHAQPAGARHDHPGQSRRAGSGGGLGARAQAGATRSAGIRRPLCQRASLSQTSSWSPVIAEPNQ